MQVFINESSLNSQYETKHAFLESIRMFLKSIKIINAYNKEKQVFQSQHFFYSIGLKGTHLGTILKADPSLNALFTQNMQEVNPKKWQSNQLHNMASSYEFMSECYTSTSTAELAERKLQNQDLIGLLLNFDKSIFGNLEQIIINKDKTHKIKIDCVVDDNDISRWLIKNKLINPDEEYDEKSKLVPMDFQTVLKDTDLFEITDYPKNNGRFVYRRKENNQLWVVDSSSRHAGSKAHIEIFDEKTGKHLGTSLYNKIDLNIKHKKDRSINKG